jgi:hypothetical protein
VDLLSAKLPIAKSNNYSLSVLIGANPREELSEIPLIAERIFNLGDVAKRALGRNQSGPTR